MLEESKKYLNQLPSKIHQQAKTLKAFVFYVLKRFSDNRSSSVAAELTITSLLALVPLMTVIFALLAVIPSFQVLGDQFQSLMFKYFVPGTGETVQNYISEFVGKAKGLSGLGSFMLFITAILMMRTIDHSFNKIWQAESNHSTLRTFLVYWAVITLGPVLLGSSLLITSYLQSLPLISNVVNQNDWAITLWLPFLMASLAFSIMFYVIPNRGIPIKHAIFSGVLTAILFELAKSAFAEFVTSFSTYQFIFGALAAVPLFLIWIYLSWLIILLGAEVCHGLDAFSLTRQDKRQHPFIELVELLLLLAEYQQKGEELSLNVLKIKYKQSKRRVMNIWLTKLVENKQVAQTDAGAYCLLSAASTIDYLSLYEVADRKLPSSDMIAQSNLPDKIKFQLEGLVNHFKQLFSGHLVIEDHLK